MKPLVVAASAAAGAPGFRSGRGSMRATVGLAVAVAAAIAAALGAGVGCGHDSKPVVQPDEHPPLPPASGTPIGYLVDASELKLRDDQLVKLKAIDADLAAKLEVLDGELRGASPSAAAPTQTAGRGRGRGFRGGGRMGGRSAARAGGGTGSGSGSAGGGRGRRRAAPGASADASGRITEERAADVRAALDKALAVLDPVQRVIARRVLADRGVDLDAGRPRATPAQAEEATEPDEPDEPDVPDVPGGDAGSAAGSGSE